MTDSRITHLQLWLQREYNFKPELHALNNDASFRKYYRFKYNNVSFVAVDSPPQRENNRAFVGVQEILRGKHVNVPQILNYNESEGFLVLEDFGDDILLPRLKTAQQPELLYQLAIDQLLKIQSCDPVYLQKYSYRLPEYDDNLLTYEMELFREWFLKKYLQIELTKTEHSLLDKIFAKMIVNAHAQPQVLVHRDFHSRNLICNNNKIAVIDFQDAVWGPVTYDLISLYRDCYIAWPVETVQIWALEYLEQAKTQGIISKHISNQQFWHWFLAMTLQRNFKTIGIFCRLFLRDNKPVYLNDIPRTLGYALAVAQLLAFGNDDAQFFGDLYNLLNNKILSELNKISIDVKI